MKLNQKLRKLWHDLFYKNASQRRLQFGLKCRDVSAALDLNKKANTANEQFRFWLHLSVCQSCRNYYDFGQALSKALKKSSRPSTPNIQQINKKLLENHSHKNDSNQNLN